LVALKAGIWEVLLVRGEGDTLISQKIPDVGYVCRNLVEVVLKMVELVIVQYKLFRAKTVISRGIYHEKLRNRKGFLPQYLRYPFQNYRHRI
jgi:hypothetical protein